jgi:hypothetical protein
MNTLLQWGIGLVLVSIEIAGIYGYLKKKE